MLRVRELLVEHVPHPLFAELRTQGELTRVTPKQHLGLPNRDDVTYKQDQTVVLHHYQDLRGSHAGLSVTDRQQDRTIADAFRELGLEPPVERSAMMARFAEIPEAERGTRLAELFGGANRVFVGTTRSRDAVLVLSDAQGRPRLRFGVPADGTPYVRLLDEAGEVVWEIGEGEPGTS